MKFKAKQDLILKDINGRSWYLIKEGKVYSGEYTTNHIVVICEDGQSKKFTLGQLTDNFYSLEEWREIQLDSILN